jgi:CRP/FNR family transcriptional regulator, cyclic AMP receptor protein
VRIRRRILDLLDMVADVDEAGMGITQDDLAGWAGTTRGTVNRVVREEVQLGTLRNRRGRMAVVDRAGLSRRAHRP